MGDLLKCAICLSALSVAWFLLGRIMPKRWFHGERFPFRPFRFEKEGRIYHTLGIRKWKDGLPDMSVILPFLIPSKKLPQKLTMAHLELMIQETCVAEWVHVLLCLLGFGRVFLWNTVGGWLLAVLYALGNIPYIIIQRYNRPKLMRLLRRLIAREYSRTR